MKQPIILLLSFLLICHTAQAQQYNWIHGGGSTDALNNGIVQEEVVKYMCVDDHSNIYALSQVGETNIVADTFHRTAYNSSNTDWHILLTSYDCNGNMRFAKLLESLNNGMCYGLQYAAGNIYITGALTGNNKHIGEDTLINTDYDNAFVAKFDTLGKYKWIHFEGDNTLNNWRTQGPSALAIDGSGNIHHYMYMLSGGIVDATHTISALGNYDICYDPAGNILSVTPMQLADTYIVKRVEIDKTTGKYFSSFEYRGTDYLHHASSILAAFYPNGNRIWMDTTVPLTALTNFHYYENQGIYFTACSNGGNIFSLGGKKISNSFGSLYAYTIWGKTDAATGQTQWMKYVSGISAIGGFTDLTILPDGSFAGTGVMAGQLKYEYDSLQSPVVEGQNPMFVNIDTNGTIIQWDVIHGDNYYDYGSTIVSDKAGNVYMGGKVQTKLWAGTAAPYMSNGGNSDFFVMKYGYDCNCSQMAIPNASFTTTVADSITHKLKFTYTGTNPKDSLVWTLGDGTTMYGDTFSHAFAKTGMYQVCLKVYVPCGHKRICSMVYAPFKDTGTGGGHGGGNSISTLLGNNTIQVYPNPAHTVLNIDGLPQATQLKIMDMTGRSLLQTIAYTEKQSINIQSLAPGNYMLILTDNEGNRVIKKIAKE